MFNTLVIREKVNANWNHMRYHFLCIRRAIIKKRKKIITSIRKDVEKLEPLCTVGRNVNGTAAVENSVAVSQKI